jgi:dUTP pyrophosphatase
MMSVKIKKLTSTANIPVRATPFAAGADLHADIESTGLRHIVIGVNERVVIPTGIALSIPSGYYGEIAPRSGLAVKSGIMVMGGILDSDFRGGVLVVLYNSGNTPVVIKQNERIAQLILHKLPDLEFEVVDDLDETDRGEGGFGSTGV